MIFSFIGRLKKDKCLRLQYSTLVFFVMFKSAVSEVQLPTPMHHNNSELCIPYIE